MEKTVGEREAMHALGLKPEAVEAAGMSFFDMMALVRQMLALGAQFPKLLPLVRQLFTAISAQDWLAAVRVAMALVAILSPESPVTPVPTPGPDPFAS